MLLRLVGVDGLIHSLVVLDTSLEVRDGIGSAGSAHVVGALELHG
jgi:hypothetical protein